MLDPSPNPPHAMRPQQPATSNQQPDKKPWPLLWVFIVILLYIALQTAYFLFFAK